MIQIDDSSSKLYINGDKTIGVTLLVQLLQMIEEEDENAEEKEFDKPKDLHEWIVLCGWPQIIDISN